MKSVDEGFTKKKQSCWAQGTVSVHCAQHVLRQGTVMIKPLKECSIKGKAVISNGTYRVTGPLYIVLRVFGTRYGY